MSENQFNAWYFPYAQKSVEGERFCYVGCVHDVTPVFCKRLLGLAKLRPNHLIFCGDVTGSPELEMLKRLFYNHVHNRARQELGMGTQNEIQLDDGGLLKFVGKTSPYQGCTMRQGFLDVVEFLFQLEGDTPEEASRRGEKLTEREISHGIQEIANYSCFTDWVLQLSPRSRITLFERLEENAVSFLEAIKGLGGFDFQVSVVGGNWDIWERNRRFAGDGVSVFDTVGYLRDHGVNFYEQLGTLTTATTVHVMVPFGVIGLTENESLLRELDVLVSKVRRGREDGKTIIAIVHGEPNLLIHNLVAGDPVKTVCRPGYLLVDNVGEVLNAIRPDEVVYAHQHNPIVGSDGKSVGHNTKYVLQVLGEGVDLVGEKAKFGDRDQVIATYLSYQRFGYAVVPLSGLRTPTLFGGERQPVEVLDL